MIITTVARDALALSVAAALLGIAIVVVSWFALAVRTVAGAHWRARRRPVALRGLDGWLSPVTLADLDEALDRVALDALAGRRLPRRPL